MELRTGERCAKCGYDLTGLRSLGQCPECGALYDKSRNIGIHVKNAVSPTAGDELLGKITRIGCGVTLGLLALLIIALGFLRSAFTQNLSGGAIGMMVGGVLAMAATVVLLGLRKEQ
jgi:hypothetical protein